MNEADKDRYNDMKYDKKKEKLSINFELFFFGNRLHIVRIFLSGKLLELYYAYFL